MPDADNRSLPWTLSQRRAILAVLSLVLVYLVILLIRDRQYVPDPLPVAMPLADELADRVDPNTADIATLAALPGLGEKRAAVIVAFRERVQAREPGVTVFREPTDLLKVRGIGAAMLENLRPYLHFPDATTRPSRIGD